MTSWFISRHPGAQQWAQHSKIAVDYFVPHVSNELITQIKAGDRVMGTLPVNLAAKVCAVGAKYFNLTLDLPKDLRGTELSLQQMLQCHARLEEFTLAPQPNIQPNIQPSGHHSQIHSSFAPLSEDKIFAESFDYLAQLPILQIKLHARSCGMTCPDNIGSAWHGALGKALHDDAPQAYELLIGKFNQTDVTKTETQSAPQTPPPPIVLRPHPPDCDVSPGAAFIVSIVLIGKGIEHREAVIAALKRISQMGVGPNLGQFQVEQIEQNWVQPAALINKNALASNHAKPTPAMPTMPPKSANVALHFLSPALLKQNNRHADHAPSLELIINRIINRTHFLMQQHLPDKALSSQVKRALLLQARQIHPIDTQLEWIKTRRYSAKSKKWMAFNGLIGSIILPNVPPSLLLWLQLTEWIHIGNKTTFGYGRIALIKQ